MARSCLMSTVSAQRAAPSAARQLPGALASAQRYRTPRYCGVHVPTCWKSLISDGEAAAKPYTFCGPVKVLAKVMFTVIIRLLPLPVTELPVALSVQLLLLWLPPGATFTHCVPFQMENRLVLCSQRTLQPTVPSAELGAMKATPSVMAP